jgi:RNA polymerase sigma-70 factor, ECF subfamily
MLNGEEEAFEDFFNSYFPALFRFSLTRLNHDSRAAEEVVQKALCKAISKLSTYRGEAALFTWLCTFCRHEISGYLKEEIGYQTQFIEDTPEILGALESLVKSAGDQPDKIMLRKEIARMVQIALDALPVHYADALEWKYIEDLPVKQIAERMNLGLKATESLLTRAREAFRDAFSTVTSGVAWQEGMQRRLGQS